MTVTTASGESLNVPPAKAVEYIDCTPSWKGVLPILLFALAHGTREGKAAAREELDRMAGIADSAVAAAKAKAA